jgi:DinB superfamily
MPDPGTLLTEARRELARLLPVLDLLTGDLDGSAWRARPAAAEWSPIEIVCHLRDEEAEDFPARLRVVVTGGGSFAPIDPERWAEERYYRDADPREALAALRTLRATSLRFLGTLATDRLSASVEHPRLGTFSGADLVVAWVAHDRLHLRQLAGTLARLWADRWAPLKVDYAGPIPYSPGTPD